LNQSHPAITVVIPTHNRASFLKRAIDSVLSQTWKDFELIIVDDASTDNTAEIIRSYYDSRIVYIRHQENKGGSAARNSGILQAKGRYIALLDDDDEWAPTKLEKQFIKFQDVSEKVGIVYSGFEVKDQDRKVIERRLPEFKGNLYMRLLERNMIGGSSTPLIKRECFDAAGLFNESLRSCQDWDMWLRISKLYEFDFVPEIGTNIYLHGDQISEDFSSMIPGRSRMIETHMDEFSAYPGILVIHLKRMGKMHCINGTWKEAFAWFAKAIDVNHLEIIKISAWCLIELPRIKMLSKFKYFKKYRP